MKRNRKVKILATLGPASNNETMIEKLHRAGADLFRINMSHASHDVMRSLIGMIRAVEARSGRPIGILADLQGPKLRVGKFAAGSAELTAGQTFTLDNRDEPGDSTRVYLPHPEILEAVKPGHRLLIDDGKLHLQAVECDGTSIVAKVVAGTKISDKKGVSLPDTLLGIGALTDKDRADLDAVVATGSVDWVALSFVQRAEDVAEVKKIARGRALVMAKIEKPQAISRLAEIIELSDALMVARGDLGVEMPLEKVPGLQKRITRMTRRAGKPVVVATQMLESMIQSPVPTRAEVSDVATAVFEGADAVMLSAESAAGQYPVEAVATMNRIAEEVETDSVYRAVISGQRAAAPDPSGADAIAVAARDMAETLDLKAVCAWTASGSTAFRIARERPGPPILALTPNRDTARRLALVWGVHAIVTKDASDIDDMARRASKFSNREGFSEVGDRIIIVAGVPFGTPGATNMIRIGFCGAES